MKKLIAGLALAVTAFASHAAVVEVVPSSTTVNVGDEFTLSIVGNAFPASSIQGGGFDITIDDPAVLQYQWLAGPPVVADVTFAPVWNFLTDPGVLNNPAGTVTGLNFNAFPGVNGPSFAIAELKLRAVDLGTSNILLSANIFAFGTDGVPIEIGPEGFRGAQIVVVPEPATWGMLAAGLALVGFLSMRRQAGAHG